MRRSYLLVVILAVFALFLAACGDDNGTNDTVALATEIDPDTDVCEICAMAIADDQHATQIVLENDRVLKFDDLGCLYEWKEDNGEDEIGAEFVRDFLTEEWIQVEDATYVFDEDIDTPMAYGIISFKDATDAESYIEDHDAGELLEPADLEDHKWEMMDHDHDHDHDNEDEDHDHED